MRRETKAGVVVTCSFLALLGVVLFSKYRQIDLDRAAGLVATAGGAETDPGAPVAAVAPASVAGAFGLDGKPTPPPSGVVQAGHHEMQPVEGGKPLPIAPPPASPEPKPTPEPPAPTPPGPTPAPAPEPSKPARENKATQHSETKVAGTENGEEGEDEKKRARNGTEPAEKQETEDSKQVAQATPQPPAPTPPAPPAPPEPKKEEVAPPPPAPPSPASNAGESNGMTSTGNERGGEVAPPPSPSPGAGGMGEVAPPPAPPSAPVPLPKPEDIGVPPAAPKPSEPPAPEAPTESATPTPEPRPSGGATGVRLESPTVIPTGGATEAPAGPPAPTAPMGDRPEPVTPKPPLGAPAAAVSPPIVVPGPGALASAPSGPPVPQVESFDEETYRCKAGESFATISKQKYLTENYARALLVYNRNHPQAADALRQEPPALADGTMVFIPPVSILEKRYASMIPNLTPIARPTPPPAPAPAATVSNARPARPAVPPVGAGLGAATTYPQYKVVEPRGEMMWQIARQALGNSERWAEVYRLNQGYKAEFPIPAGAVLRLPMGARVPAANQP